MKLYLLSGLMCGVLLLSCTIAQEIEASTYEETTDDRVIISLSSTQDKTFSVWWIIGMGAVLLVIFFVVVYLAFKIKTRRAYRVQQLPKARPV